MATTSVKNRSYNKLRSATGITTMKACSAKDSTSSSEQIGAKGVTISHTLQSGLPKMAATSYRDNSSRKQRKTKGIKKEKASPANTEKEDATRNKALLNFGRLLELYQSSPTPPAQGQHASL